MKKTFVRTQNVKNFISLMNSLQNKPEGVPRMALVYGEPGLGKSRTALWWAVKNDAVYLRSSNMMSGRWFLEELVEELGETPYYKTSDLFKQAVNQLLQKPRVILIDEIDYLTGDSKAIETIRDLHDKTNAPVVLLGMNKADRKIMRYRHVYDRLSEILKFQPFDKKEIQDIIRQLSEVEFTECAVELVFTQANRLRQIVGLIDKAEKIAIANNLNQIDSRILRTGIKEIVEQEKKDEKPVAEINQRIKKIHAR
jgi:DNA transposition AAA+ family ATPase